MMLAREQTNVLRRTDRAMIRASFGTRVMNRERVESAKRNTRRVERDWLVNG